MYFSLCFTSSSDFVSSFSSPPPSFPHVGDWCPHPPEKICPWIFCLCNACLSEGLDLSVTKEELTELFSQFGKLADVRLVTYRNGHSKVSKH